MGRSKISKNGMPPYERDKSGKNSYSSDNHVSFVPFKSKSKKSRKK